MIDGVAVIGAGRIGAPWAAVLGTKLDIDVTCIDIDEERVATLNRGESPFEEPHLAEYISNAVDAGKLTATTDPEVVTDHQYVAFTVNAPRNGMAALLDTVRDYASRLNDDHVLINRVTLPVDMIERMQATVNRHAKGSPTFVMFPERLAEGKAITEIETLPKIVGVNNEAGRNAMRDLLEGLNCPIRFTDLETAMFVKLVDNSFRDGLFAIANQIAYTADELELDAHEAISLANYEYPRNDIPSPGPVGGKCLPKDPHFLTDERVCDQPTTPDLFNTTRRTNASLSAHATTEILRQRPSTVAMLGLSYKRGVGDTYNSPAKDIAESLVGQGVSVCSYDPYVETSYSLDEVLPEADIVVLGVNHDEFEGIERRINEFTKPDSIVYDLWGFLDETQLNRDYDGFGVA